NSTVQNWYGTPRESLRESREAMSARHFERPPQARRRVAVVAADWWLPVTDLQSPIDGVNSSTGCNWFIWLRLCSLPLPRLRVMSIRKLKRTISITNLKQASIALKQGKSMIIAGLAESKKDHAIEFLAKLEVGMDKLHKITEDRKREAVVPKQKELL
nr:peptidyl-prolyl cis-trans isomerase CYP38, chloroplastic [Tanacetum cinerariifolium]